MNRIKRAEERWKGTDVDSGSLLTFLASVFTIMVLAMAFAWSAEPTIAPPRASLLRYQPATCPPDGICLPVQFVRARDGDTVVVSFADSKQEWAVRLLECWVDDSPGPKATAAMKEAAAICEQAESMRLFVPFSHEDKPVKHPTDLFSFDRVLGYVYLDDTHTLNAAMVERGYATTEKPVR